MLEKTCSRCKETKSVLDFYKRSKSDTKYVNCKAAYASVCRECTTIASKEYYYNNREKALKRAWVQRQNPNEVKKLLAYKRKRLYGVDGPEFERMTVEQKGLCAICGKPGPLAVDHDHQTGKVRALLHRTCNSALGLLKEDFDIIIGMAKYIQLHKGVI